MENPDDINKLIEAYLRNELDEDSLGQFEAQLKSDLKFAEQIKNYKEIYSVLDESSWAISEFDAKHEKSRDYLKFYTNKENQDYFKKLKQLDYQEQSTKNFNVRALFGTIAVAAALVVSFLIYNNINRDLDYKAIASNYSAYDDIPSITVRGKNDSIIGLIETNFNNKAYKAVSDLVTANQDAFTKEERSLLYLYQGVSFGEQNEYEKAYETLANNEIFENTVYKQMADWYLALSNLKSQNVSEAKKMLTQFSKDSNHYKQSEAKEILKKIK